MASLDLSPTCKEIKYTVHGSTIYIVAIDMRDKPFFFQSMDIDLIEVRSLSLKAKGLFLFLQEELHVRRLASRTAGRSCEKGASK